MEFLELSSGDFDELDPYRGLYLTLHDIFDGVEPLVAERAGPGAPEAGGTIGIAPYDLALDIHSSVEFETQPEQVFMVQRQALLCYDAKTALRDIFHYTECDRNVTFYQHCCDRFLGVETCSSSNSRSRMHFFVPSPVSGPSLQSKRCAMRPKLNHLRDELHFQLLEDPVDLEV